MKWFPIIKLDFDGPNPPKVAHRLRFLWRYNRQHFPTARFRMRHRRTKNGWHVVIDSDSLRLTPTQTVAVQAILGSDWRREAFMLTRAVVLHRVPSDWQKSRSWNTLYDRKL